MKLYIYITKKLCLYPTMTMTVLVILVDDDHTI